MTASAATPCGPSPATAWGRFNELLPAELLSDLDPKAAQAACAPWVVTWLLVFQRL